MGLIVSVGEDTVLNVWQACWHSARSRPSTTVKALSPKPQTLNRRPQTPNPKPQTLNPKP